MYKHQVIEDLSLRRDLTPEQTIVLECVKKAESFHLSDINGLTDPVCAKYRGSMLFFDQSGDVRLPYDYCWFDYEKNRNGNKYKTGIIVKKMEEDLILVCLFRKKNKDPWFFRPLGFYISIGKFMREQVDLVQRVTAAGKIIHDMLDGNLWPLGIACTQEEYSAIRDKSPYELVALNSALLLLSCKNIGTEKHYPPEALNKKRRSKGKIEISTYHTLVLKPFGKRQESIPKDLWNNRIHLQRGHFKTYTEERPLFGKYTGRFFWDWHVRGRNKSGAVIKDYKMQSWEEPNAGEPEKLSHIS